MALASLGLVALTPSIYIHPSTYSNVPLLQQRQTSLATLWGSAASFGIASFLFQWISKRQFQPQQEQQQYQFSTRLDKQLHFGLLVFCTLGLVAIPGEFGMRLVKMDALASSPPLQWISSLGLFVATMARVSGLWTAIYGIQAASKSTPTLTTTSTVKSDIDANPPEMPMEPTSVLAYQKKNWFHRLWTVPKSYRKQTLFYRNIMLVLMTAAGSNLMEAIFRWRYRTALAQPFSALDISLSISSGARLMFLTILMYALKVGSEALPPLFTETKSWNYNSRTNNSNQSMAMDDGNPPSNPMDLAPSSTISTPSWTMSQRHLAKALSKVNLLVAIWALVVSLGQGAMRMRPGVVIMAAKPELLLLAGLLTIKSYRLWICPGDVKAMQ